MKRAQKLLWVVAFVLIYCTPSIAAESCNAIVIIDNLENDQDSSHISRSLILELNGEHVGKTTGARVYVLKGIPKENRLVARVGYGNQKLDFSCGSNNLALLNYDSFRGELKQINEGRAHAKLDSRLGLYKRVQYFTPENGKLKKYYERRLWIGGPLLARIYEDLGLDVQSEKRDRRSTGIRATRELPKANVNRFGVAVIVANQNYSSHNSAVPNVEYAHNDADQIYDYVTQTLGFNKRNVIMLKDASLDDLIETFGKGGSDGGKLGAWVRPGYSDVFVYYSGHGVPGTSNGESYLLPVETDPRRVEQKGYPLKTLYASLAKISAKSMTVVLEASFSGKSPGGVVNKNAAASAVKDATAAMIPSAATFSAASPAEVAISDKERKMGLFTRFFLEGAKGKADDKTYYGNGDGKVTVGELKEYLQEVTYWAKRQYDSNQHPQVSGAGDQVLLELH